MCIRDRCCDGSYVVEASGEKHIGDPTETSILKEMCIRDRENREPIRLTTKPEPYTLQKALHWLQRQVAPTIKMVQALDKENHTTILKDMIEQAELKGKHKHLLQLEKSTIEERIDTAVDVYKRQV